MIAGSGAGQGRALLPAGSPLLAIFTARPEARRRLRDFFSSHIRNRHTRRAYLEAVRQFSAFCAELGIADLDQVEPVHVAAFVEREMQTNARPTVKQRLAALRMLFDWMVVGQIIPGNPAQAVRGPKYTQKKGKTPVLAPDEARTLLDSISTDTPVGLRDRALIGLMVYSFARVGAVLGMKVEDYFIQARRGWVRLHEKGGKLHEMPTHHNLDRYLEEYLAAAGLREDRNGPLFRTARGRSGELTERPMLQSDVWRMIRRRALAAGIKTEIGCHSFRATGITAYLKNGEKLEIAQQMAGHESARTTGLYDRRADEISLDEVERVGI
ncbi:MAG TPA: tyrosine-type recombinase/integrase [Armatimonadota bacterium]|nr:tyrosine-type recombinase/integrase [Armatimonadota bacterium]